MNTVFQTNQAERERRTLNWVMDITRISRLPSRAGYMEKPSGLVPMSKSEAEIVSACYAQGPFSMIETTRLPVPRQSFVVVPRYRKTSEFVREFRELIPIAFTQPGRSTVAANTYSR